MVEPEVFLDFLAGHLHLVFRVFQVYLDCQPRLAVLANSMIRIHRLLSYLLQKRLQWLGLRRSQLDEQYGFGQSVESYAIGSLRPRCLLPIPCSR